ncbi:hypothetical protein OGAPHI_006135 [Ogataea philodendri]|uniref:SPS-sensor serine protease component SSY5 n=1 Tax=Ogataea philodendri TaxID=1378263 RepID=A0A9P8T1R1_9ASCO|nr:uncharacterized protein OGAPHI_006135 [Ogataea philodendri]KAH3661956.1 hypothetical protein OGAPHI_006135 [Ogataea philodendri]
MAFKLFKRKDEEDSVGLPAESYSDMLTEDVTAVQSNNDDSKTFQYSFNSNTNSLFSAKPTISTGKSSQQSSYGKETPSTFTSIGRPLRVVDEEEFEDDTLDNMKSLRQSFSRRKSNISEDSRTNINPRSRHGSNAASEIDQTQLVEVLEKHLRALAVSTSNTLMQVSQSVLNLTKASIAISESIESTSSTISKLQYLQYLAPFQFSTSSSPGLHKLIKNVLFLIDNHLLSEVYDSSKSLLSKNLYDLLGLLKVVEFPSRDLENFATVMTPNIFPIGSTNLPLALQAKIGRIMQMLVQKSKELSLSDQEGAFIAPVLRGFLHEDLSVVTFIFGFPTLNKEHIDIVRYFSSSIDNMHFVAQKNQITAASTSKFRAPFRTVDPDSEYMPISMPVACNNSLKLSGTLAGYLYPRIPENSNNPRLQKYENSLFGFTCAHVMLNESIKSGDPYPHVSVPSPVLVNLYKNALLNERLKYDAHTEEYRAYDSVVQEIDQLYPVTEVRVKKKTLTRNLPRETFGQLIWGERVLNEDKLSDIAIVKILDQSKKFVNFLGEDLELNKHDPALMFSNLYVKKVVHLKTSKETSAINHAGLEVFKVGATTDYTDGRLNGQKMIYWSDGSLKTSEFVISGSQKQFAAGGDSGALVLAKLSSLRQPTTNKRSMLSSFLGNLISQGPETGLGVVGMLHSYDGEHKQFGLFTPMDSILERLHTVTGVDWGVVGCTEDTD